MIVKMMIIGHIIGDFYAQTDLNAKERKHDKLMLMKRCILYIIIMGLCSFTPLFMDEVFKFLMCIAFIGILHGIVDFIKILIEKKVNINSIAHIYLFFIEQIFYIAIILLAYNMFNITGSTYLNLFGRSYEISSFNNIINLAICLLICGQPASTFIKLVFSTIKNEVEGFSQDDTNPRIGSYIGILERIIILFLGMLGQYSAIGFVLTAKSVARYKQLEDKNFAEKYLVGTLLSSLISIVCVGVYNYYKM